MAGRPRARGGGGGGARAGVRRLSRDRKLRLLVAAAAGVLALAGGRPGPGGGAAEGARLGGLLRGQGPQPGARAGGGQAAEDGSGIQVADKLPGWEGERAVKAPENTVGERRGAPQERAALWKGEVRRLSWSPRAFLFKGLLTDAECDHLVELAKSHMEKSSVVDNASGLSKASNIRTSSGAFLGSHQTEIISRIEERISAVTFIPQANGEGLQILRYQEGQKYDPHWDYFHDKLNAAPERGGQRYATMLMYLSTPREGGETVFPNAAGGHVEGPEWSTCAKRGNAVHAVKGDALFFYSMTPGGQLDKSSLHGGCPVIKGEKWSATKWMHVGKFDPFARIDPKHLEPDPPRVRPHVPGACEDWNDNCDDWASSGECDKNPGYMHKECRLSCKLCPTNSV